MSAASLCHLAWAQVLARVPGREDVVFGTVLFGRMQGGAGAERVIGAVHQHAADAALDWDAQCGQSLRATHELLAELLRHEHASLGAGAALQRGGGAGAAVHGLFNYRYSQGAVLAEESAQAWEGITGLQSEERTNYPLTLSVDDLGEGFSLNAQVSTAVEPQRVCEFMCRALTGLVEALEGGADRAIRAIDVLPSVERERVLVEWNATQSVYPQDRCIQQLFEEQVQRAPDGGGGGV